MKYKLGFVALLIVVLLIAGVAIKFALWRTMFAYGTSLFMLGLVMLLVAAAVMMLTLRGRRVSN
jgi:cytochrome b subunit of formate dehydrogenase